MSIEAILFDVNGTLLDLSPLRAFLSGRLGAGADVEWLSETLRSAMAFSLTGDYRDFDWLARAALHDLAARRGAAEVHELERELARCLRSLPPRPGAEAAVRRLRGEGLRVAALSNSAPATLSAQLRSAGLAACFDEIMSVESVRRFKPAPEPYRMAALRLETAIADAVVVTVHDWDALGSVRAGAAVAFVSETGAVPEWLPPPFVVGRDLGEVAERICEAVD